jgi:uncharacterized protein YbjT (DUF2867 family)
VRIVVVGGSGLLGSRLVTRLAGEGHDAVAASPSTGVDTLTGRGVAEVLAGTDVVVDATNSPSFADDAVLDFFTRSGRTLLAAEAAAGVRHHVAVSIVGTDRLPESGYLRAKVAQEELVAASGVPWTVLRATQFHEFVASIVASLTGDGVVRVPDARLQTVAADEVAATLARLAAEDPRHGRVELGGPETVSFAEAARRSLAAQETEREVVADPSARYFGTPLTGDELVAGADALHGTVRFDEWLHTPAGVR